MIGELRQDGGLPRGTKVVPITAVISPLIIIVQGSHRRRSILSRADFDKHIMLLSATGIAKYVLSVKKKMQARMNRHDLPQEPRLAGLAIHSRACRRRLRTRSRPKIAITS